MLRKCSCALVIGLLVTLGAHSATEDMGGGFSHHGVAVPVSTHRGVVATVDGAGRDVVLLWLYDHRGGYALLLVDAESGRSETFALPFSARGDGPFASVLSSKNKFYSHFGSHFCEFDPAKRAFTFHAKSAPQMAMSMTEDERGVIWSATYPNCGLVSFDPATREFRDYGSLNRENWAQYPRAVACDDSGWVYVSVGSTARQIVAFDLKSRKSVGLLSGPQRSHGSLVLVRDRKGKVYCTLDTAPKYQGLELTGGVARQLAVAPQGLRPLPVIAGSQGLFHDRFPSGKRLTRLDLVARQLSVTDPKTRQMTTVAFDYQSEGAVVMGVATAPDGTLCGGTAFPMRFFSFDPRTDRWVHREAFGQWNTVTRQGDRFFVGGYGHGFLLEWNPAQPWVNTIERKSECNPRWLTQCAPSINRPHTLLAHANGRWVVLGGTPGYGLTGGGLLVWDRQKCEPTLIEHDKLVPDQSPHSLTLIDDNLLLVGTTTAAGTGGEKRAKVAELCLLDLQAGKVVWQDAVLPGVQTFAALHAAPNGKVYGIADYVRLFVFDPKSRRVVREQALNAEFGRAVGQQGPRVFVGPDPARPYMLFDRIIGRLDTETGTITNVGRSPVPIGAGGDWLGGRVYYASGSHLYSFAPEAQ